MHLFLKVFILVERSMHFRQSFRPSSGAQNCIYMATGICQTASASNSSCLTYAHCCMCSFELLMMDGKTVRNV